MRAIPLLLLLPLVLAACRMEGERVPPDATPNFGEIIRYNTPDLAHIVAELALPEDVDSPPVVILLHQFRGHRGQWDPLVPHLLERGYAVLAPDLRSFGDSTVCVVDDEEVHCELDDFDTLNVDVETAIELTQGNPEVDGSRIAVAGASIGGNLAYVASGAFPEVSTAIAMSPSAAGRNGSLLGQDVEDFEPRSVLFMSDLDEADDAQSLAESVAAPVDVRVYEVEDTHGVELLELENAVQDFLAWLDQHLR